MEDLIKTETGNQIKKRYRLKNHLLPQSERMDWPSYLTIDRSVKPKKKTVLELTHEALLKVYGASGVLVDKIGNIRYVYGHTGLFLEPAQGYSGATNILKMARQKLRRDLNKTLHLAITRQTTSSSAIIQIKRNGETMSVLIRVIPLLKKALKGQDDDFYLVIFEKKADLKVETERSGFMLESANSQSEQRLLTLITDEIEVTRTKLSDLKSEFENTQLELEVSRNKLHSVKLNIDMAETELQTLRNKISGSKEERQLLSDGQQSSITDKEVVVSVQQTQIEEQRPFGEELATIKNELSMATEALEQKKNAFEKMNQTFKATSGELSFMERQEKTESENGPDLEPTTQVANMAENVVEPVFPKTTGLNFGSESELLDNNIEKSELRFKDAAEFQAAANHGYRHDNGIKSVYIPEGVDTIKRSMFYKCTQLEKVSFPNSLKFIEGFAFYGCEKLENINLDTCKVLEVIGTSTFEGCVSMVELRLPDSLIEIEEAAFLGCRTMETIAFQENCQLEILGSHVFKDCEKLKQISLPDQIKHIGISCFYGCRSLTKVRLPKELETLGEYAFFGCEALTEIEQTNKQLLKQPGFSVGLPEGIKIL